MIQTYARSLLLIALAAPLASFAADPAPAGPDTAAAAPAPAHPGQAAAAAPEVSLVEMVRALSQFLTEDEVQMVYDYLWDSSLAALKGSQEEVTLPPELAFKLAILQKRIVKEGGVYLQGLALKMEKDLAHFQENLNTPTAPAPYSLPSERAAPKQP
ncbi:hypothetical protein EZJ19_08960 [Parasulfuritortus cantonensis]|uniref:DUF3300 domain-containing protein n=1 Tax=Parasulfuritortus cantonensis TaxID=2528202 RepID=A0A4R1BCE6_9PROT|nr:hypothetical protein [Parasulfuritortus cantonensis]TCJ14706.1 hypothetical protein EZJ19_08960 [Parasulfuritortus cantonensis]